MTSPFDWQCCCHLAILETDPRIVRLRVLQTQIEIQARLIDLAAIQDDSSEIAQIKDALKTLDVLDRESHPRSAFETGLR
jgi:hypothetical protein